MIGFLFATVVLPIAQTSAPDHDAAKAPRSRRQFVEQAVDADRAEIEELRRHYLARSMVREIRF